MNKVRDLTAAILVGGLGLRLRSVVSDKPKVLAEVSGKAFLSYLLDQLVRVGVSKAVLCCGYKAEMVQEYFGNSYRGLELLYSIEEEALGTGGAVRLAIEVIGSETVLVMNGDSYLDINLGGFIEWFFEQKRVAAIVLTEVADTSRYGRVRINENKSIASFEEKCNNSEIGLINAGIYLVEKSALASMPTGRFYSLEREFFPSLTGGDFYGYCVKGKFIDIGTPQSYAIAEKFFADTNYEGLV